MSLRNAAYHLGVREVIIGNLMLEGKKNEERLNVIELNGYISDGWNDTIALIAKKSFFENGVSIVRELHVYGSMVPVYSRDPSKFQHQGYGQLLMQEAERIARNEHHSYKIAVISGVGTRNYYRDYYSGLTFVESFSATELHV
ncbi:unnamed protein product [Anisakis simplex]|uniref:Elongator complex protein 3 (inferred by orthology to a human protein) n=1 Tax=Anisakis simplex TaxID=6269 RepID=A0A0M3JVE0_ANISI|nr:unnamed protein product [Anisakis simplex]